MISLLLVKVCRYILEKMSKMMNALGDNISSVKLVDLYLELITDGWRVTPENGKDIFTGGMACYTCSIIPV